MKLLNIPFIIITISTVIGISIEKFLSINIQTILFIFTVQVGLLGLSWYYEKKTSSKGSFFTIVMIAFFITFGITLVKIHNPKSYDNHYTYLLENKNIKNKKVGIQFHIKERLKPSIYYDKYIASIQHISNHISKGKLLIRIPIDTLSEPLPIGTSYSTFTNLSSISKPKNPNQFDYAKYLEKQYIYHQITVSNNKLISNKKTFWSFYYLSDQIRTFVNNKLSHYDFDKKQLSIINALLLGQRQDIDTETLDEYKNAGAIHILAVSGLHVGIILAFLTFILSPLDRYGNRYKTIKLIATLILLWCFAIIAGLSPSVLRAVTMFSFLAIGMHIRSKTSIYNSLFISLFILLCFNPLLLFSIGFQLSYLAVFAIVWIQPKLAKHYKPKYFIPKKIWETFTVTIAAQLGLLPLSLFYFNQFPLLFFISNVLIIPFLGSILGLGVITILLACLNILPEKIATLFGLCIDYMNTSVSWVAQQDVFLIENIFFSWKMLLALYNVIITSFLTIQDYKKRRIWMVSSVLILMSIIIFEKTGALNQEEFIVFNNNNNTTVGFLKNKNLSLYSHDTLSVKTRHFLLNNYLTQKQAKLDTIAPLKNVYSYKDRTILLIDSTSIYKVKEMDPDIIILSNSPKINLERLLKSFTPRKIVADASNYRSYIKKWKTTCKKHKIPFHHTGKKGAFIVRQGK
ncbi:ComEC/Rec2 family competence protein [Aquimarina pacifica]|uniref:ComEC/Rec2 family competence protein n=1 Tax=Aquimarina pacifica TaxID=1296415 RepID=UPI000471B3EA|nr:ComEC/Rec2 family competence protein [Aquimarina pacifica]